MAEESPIVFLVDDDPSMRLAIESLLRSSGLSVRSFGSAREFLVRPKADALACLVLDVCMPETSGLDLQRELALDPSLPIVFITANGDVSAAVRAMKAGAVDYLVKPFRDHDLIDAIGRALDKARVTRRSHAELSRLNALYVTLSRRERQVLKLVVDGLLNKEIAKRLGISEVTVKSHRGQVMHKMRAHSLADLVRMAERVLA